MHASFETLNSISDTELRRYNANNSGVLNSLPVYDRLSQINKANSPTLYDREPLHKSGYTWDYIDQALSYFMESLEKRKLTRETYNALEESLICSILRDNAENAKILAELYQGIFSPIPIHTSN